jgi:hypothetical protein
VAIRTFRIQLAQWPEYPQSPPVDRIDAPVALEVRMKSLSRLLAAALAALVAPLAGASFHTFEIDSLYSNADGTVQYVVLHETAGFGGQQFLQGHQLTAQHGSTVKSFPFPSNLPSGSTGGRYALIASQGFAALGVMTPDYVMPNGFLPTDGGTVNYAGVDQVTYAALPTDGVNALKRNGNMAANEARNFAGQVGSAPALPVTAVEFYNGMLDHYFISALQPDIDALDSGRLVGWVRTGQSFHVYPSQAVGGAGVNPVCRIYIPPPLGDSHFFSASPQECTDTLAKFPTFEFESPAVFYIALPTTAGPTAGACPAGTVPVYRVFDNRADANHRYTTSRTIRDQMVALGYIAEGYGDDAVIMCAAS